MYEVYDTAQDVTTTAVGPSYLLHSPSVWLGPHPPQTLCCPGSHRAEPSPPTDIGFRQPRVKRKRPYMVSSPLRDIFCSESRFPSWPHGFVGFL